MRGFFSYPVALGVAGALCIVVALAFVLNTASVSSNPEVPAWVTEFNQTEAAKKEVTPVAATPVMSPGGRLKITPGVERWYAHDAPQFTFMLPDGFAAPDIDTGVRGVSGVQVSDTRGIELVVYVYPISSGTQVDAATIRSYFPDAQISGLKETTIGTVVRAFIFTSLQSDGTTMLNLWAAYNGYVYTLTTPTENEDLFTFIKTHWFFAPATPSPPQKK